MASPPASETVRVAWFLATTDLLSGGIAHSVENRWTRPCANFSHSLSRANPNPVLRSESVAAQFYLN